MECKKLENLRAKSKLCSFYSFFLYVLGSKTLSSICYILSDKSIILLTLRVTRCNKTVIGKV